MCMPLFSTPCPTATVPHSEWTAEGLTTSFTPGVPGSGASREFPWGTITRCNVTLFVRDSIGGRRVRVTLDVSALGWWQRRGTRAGEAPAASQHACWPAAYCSHLFCNLHPRQMRNSAPVAPQVYSHPQARIDGESSLSFTAPFEAWTYGTTSQCGGQPCADYAWTLTCNLVNPGALRGVRPRRFERLAPHCASLSPHTSL